VNQQETINNVAKNRLAGEKSPYLLQHAEDPVHWYPWGQEAFQKALEEDKPIFLSIGYSTCHWCHVMARECFQDRQVAQELNESFISIKVDREERPDVDHIYMSVCQMITGSGGWPLTVIATPDRKPFFAGTYFPKVSRFGLPGLLNILQVIKEAWENNRKPLLDQADKIYRAIQERRHESDVDLVAVMPKEKDDYEALLDKGFTEFSKSFDEDSGGFGVAPKFLSPHNLMFLMAYWKRTGNKRALDIVERTVKGAYSGGIYDHLGFGFFRYATDSKWLVPHFEKMLYDNAMMLKAVTELYQATQKAMYKDIALEIVSFARREMLSSQGGFYSAIDAESQGVEGKFYVWTRDEVVSLLGKDDGRVFCDYYGIEDGGSINGGTVPHLVDPTVGPREPAIERTRARMLLERDKRVRPMTDDKILTSWNSLMISALAKTSYATGDEACLEMAERCAAFILENLLRDGTLYARYRQGDVAFSGGLCDYAYFVESLLDLYQATYSVRYLERAWDLTAKMVELFWDEAISGFYLTEAGRQDLIVRPRETYDGAIPSGNSVAIVNLLRVSHLGGPEDYESMALSTIDVLAGSIARNPTGYGYLLCGVNYASGGSQVIEVAADINDPTAEAMLNYIKSLYLPGAQVIFSAHRAVLREEDPPDLPCRATLTLCQGRICSAPITGIRDLQKALMTARVRSGEPVRHVPQGGD
jgi:uncharacterized protein YyaL (SSP411 family)